MFTIDGKQYTEDPNQKLGGGSEGAVFPFPGDASLCVKLFHPPEKGDTGAEALAKYRDKKVRAICAMPSGLPDHFIIPKKVALGAKDEVVGFLMQRVHKGYFKLMKLLESTFRTDHQIGLKWILQFGAEIFQDLALLHADGKTIGDINMGCCLFTPAFERKWVDCDSWSYPGFPCMATTELFCHPDLYANLNNPGGQLVVAKPHHDRFAFTSMLSLLGIHGAHPFRMGTHQSVFSLQERTQQGITVFDKGVKYPPFLASPDTLSDALLAKMIAVLKRQTTDGLEPEFLREQAEGTITCKHCDAQYHYSRPHCPKCHGVTQAPVGVGRIAVALIIREIKMQGMVLFAQVVADKLLMACRSPAGTLTILSMDANGQTVPIHTNVDATPGTRYRFFGPCLAICPNPLAEAPVHIDLYRIDGGALQKLKDVSTGALENDSAVFDSSSGFFYRTAGNMLKCGSLFNNKTFAEDDVTQVHRSQSWFTVDRTSGANREAIFGYDRALRDLQWFVVTRPHDASKFSHHIVPLPGMRVGEKMEDFAVYFNAASVLLVRGTRYRGRQYVRYSIIGLDGQVLQDKVLADGDTGFDSWSYLHGKLFQQTSVLHVTPQGVIRNDLFKDTYEPLPDLAGVINDTDRLLRFGGSTAVLRRDAVLLVNKK